ARAPRCERLGAFERRPRGRQRPKAVRSRPSKSRRHGGGASEGASEAPPKNPVSLTTLGQAVLTRLAHGALYAVLALAFAAVFGLTRALNLAHGEWVLLGGYLGYTAGRLWGWPPLVLAPLAGVALIPIGLVWRALLHRVREPVELNSMALT